MQSFRLLTTDEIEAEFPRQVVPIAAVVAEMNSKGELYTDTCFVLFTDGHLQTPHTEMPISSLVVILQMLKTAGKGLYSEGT